MTAAENKRSLVLEELRQNAFITKDMRDVLGPKGESFNWFLDFKGVMLKPRMLDALATLFWEHMKERPSFQLGGLETAAIALIGGIAVKAASEGVQLNAFYVRKSRKVDGMQRMIEGALTDEEVVLIDDALNSGKSIVRQVEALKAEGRRVVEVCVIVAFRPQEYYEYFKKNGIRVLSIFTLEDFPETGGLLKAHLEPRKALRVPFDVQWKFSSEDPQYFHVVPKSAPVLDEERVYFGADNGTLWAIRQRDGSVAWSHRVLFGAGRKKIFSSPCLCDGVVYFGAYDGNLYALDAKTGKKRWIFMEADWVGSSPCAAEDLGSVFIGLEFGLWKKQGGIVALDAKTGEKKWTHDIETLVHSSPAYSSAFSAVVIGSESGEVYALDAKSGKKRWTHSSGGAVKGGFAFDEERGLVAFGSWDDHIHIVGMEHGEKVHAIHTHKPIYSNPLIAGGKLYMGLLDKRIVCVDVRSGNLLWEFWTHSRVFASPVVIDDSLYCGSNDGRLYELDLATGKERGFFQATERIVNKIAYNPGTERFFVPTYANELYCLSRRKDN